MAEPLRPRTLNDVDDEVRRARAKHPRSYASSHEGFAVLHEEVDELWAEVKNRTDERSYARMRMEAIQIAAVAMRFVEEVCDPRVPAACAAPPPAEPPHRPRWPCDDWLPEARCPLTNGEGHTCITATKLEALARKHRGA